MKSPHQSVHYNNSFITTGIASRKKKKKIAFPKTINPFLDSWNVYLNNKTIEIKFPHDCFFPFVVQMVIDSPASTFYFPLKKP